MNEDPPAERPSLYVIRREDAEQHRQSFSHPWNPKSEIIGAHLSRMAGLKRTGVSIATIPPGKDSFIYHSHQFEEEWIYVLSGRASVRLDGGVHELGPGDFAAFPTPGIAHLVSNPYAEPLVMLMGGENREFEIADFPEINKRMLRNGNRLEIYDLDGGKPFGPLTDD